MRARRFRAASLYVPRAEFNPVATGIETMATGLWEKKSPALAVDVVSAVCSQRDGAAKTVYVTAVITTMHSGRYGMVTQQARK
jgi:NAD(P)H-hydrate repair Nnr-like enzyme with NAD(P)H-hydrate epimerase domain